MKRRVKKRKSKKRRHFTIQRTGSLAAAISLAAVCQGYAAEVYVPANDVISLGESEFYDLDGDGTNDISFHGSIVDSCFEMWAWTVAGGTNVLMADTMGGVNVAKPYTAGANIGATVSPFLYPALPLNLGASGPFYNTDSPRFAGLCLFLSEPQDTSWGWAHLNVTPDFELEIIAFGYEDVPNTPIRPLESAAIKEEEVPALRAELLQNRPAPFSGQTQICFNLPGPTTAVIRIFDATGRVIRTIEPAATRTGFNSVSWNGCDDTGHRVASGVYFCRLDAFETVQMRKMVVLE
jgi:hypothetical protein